MTFSPELLVAVCTFSLLACSKPELPKSGISGSVRGTETAGVSTVLGTAMDRADDPMPAERLDCGHERFKFADALGQLPAGMARVLSSGGSMADYGEHFNETDEPLYAGAPFRRFAGAAIGESRIFAAIERGGVGYGVDYWAFERKGSQWVGNRRWWGAVPSSLSALLSVTCIGKGEVTGARTCTQGDYPPSALRAKAQGTTTVALTIDEAGHVSEGMVVKASGRSREHLLLDRAAAAYFRTCAFAVATDPGPRHATLSYTWSLD